MVEEFKSKKSTSSFKVTGTDTRAFLEVSGEASKNRKVKAEVERIRRSGASWTEATWTARMLASTY